MNRMPVTSSAIVSVGYDPATLTLEIEFRSGRVYEYHDRPPTIAAGLLSAASRGSYFKQHIGHAGYPFRRLP
jgi:KTSC domain